MKGTIWQSPKPKHLKTSHFLLIMGVIVTNLSLALRIRDVRTVSNNLSRDSIFIENTHRSGTLHMLSIKSATVKTVSRYLGTACSAALILGWGTLAAAQVTISDARTAPVDTDSEGDDVIIDTTGSVTLTTAGPAVTLNSDNDLTNQGAITISDVDNATGVSLEGGADRNFTNSGNIFIQEDFTPSDTDGDGFTDGGFASGSGRTGILISGASPFQGNISLASTSNMSVEGNDSFGINLVSSAALTGNLTNEGRISLLGDNGAAVNLAGNVTGTVENAGVVSARGTNSTGYAISGDVQGGFVNIGGIESNAFRFNATRPGFGGAESTGREDLTAEDMQNAGSALSVTGNITQGIFLEIRQELAVDADGNPQVDADGNPTGALVTVGRSAISQLGSAPAVLISGDGTPIAIGRVSPINDPNADGFDADLQYGFINEGTISAQGVFDDFDATIISVSNATVEGGIRNAGTLSVSAFRGTGLNPVAGITPGTGLARVIVLGEGAIVDNINNIGAISAQASEAIDEVFADEANPVAAVNVQAVAIDIGAGATTNSIFNQGIINTIVIGRQGEAYAIRDASGTLNAVTNEGAILASGQSSDSTGNSEVSFTLVAIDASANTNGFTYLQQLREDEDTTDTATPTAPFLRGDILLGSGNDVINASSGSIAGDIDFGEGEDQLLLSGGASYSGEIRNAGNLTINVTDASTLALTEGTPIAVADASFGAASTFSPTIDGSTGTASTLAATGTVAFADGSFISPRFNSIVNSDIGETFTLASAGTLSVTDMLLANLNAAAEGGTTPFLYDFDYGTSLIDGTNALIVTVTLRDPNLSIEQGGLGLDPVQAAAFNQTRGAFVANSELGSAIANITDGAEFNRAYNQLLPEFSAAAREFVLANVDGATGAVGSHLDTARRSPDKPGGAWLQEFAYFADRDLAGLSEQYRGAGFGITGGLDVAWGPFHAVGVNFGFASTEIEDVVGQDEPLDVITLQAGLYAGLARALGSGELGMEFYAGGGYNSFEQERRVRINDFFGQASSDYNGTHINASARAGYEMFISGKYWIRPALSLDYLRLSEDGYMETGTEGIALDVGSRVSERASATAMLNVGAKYQGKRTWIRPSLRVGYRQAFLNDPTLTEFAFAGLNEAERATLTSLAFPDSGVLVGFSIAAGSEYSSIGFDVDSDIRDGFIRHTGRVVIRLLF